MYLARTKDKELLVDPETMKDKTKHDEEVLWYLDRHNAPRGYPKEMKKELSKHRFIQFSMIDSALLFLHEKLSCIICPKVCNWKKRDKLMKLYNKGKDMFEEELSLINLLKNLQLLQTVQKNHIFTD